SKTVDLGVVVFPPHTAKAFAMLDNIKAPALSDAVEFFGAGSLDNPFFDLTSLLDSNMDPLDPRLTSGRNKIWRVSEQRFAFRAPDGETFAARGDSGGPVYRNGNLIGILSTIEQSCETKFGEDYSILNSAIRLDTPAAHDFLDRALKSF